MGFPRSDEARRKDALYDQISRAERSNREKDEEIVALNEKITTLEAENADLKEWRKRYEARAAERRLKSWQELVR